MINLKKSPFFLKDEEIRWVENSLKNMSVEEKIGQLFFPMGSMSRKQTKRLIDKYKVGGMMFTPAKEKQILEMHRYAQEVTETPLLLAANLEEGGNGIVKEGTRVSSQMAIAASNDEKGGYMIGKIACSEGAATGLNTTFAPVVDIDMNFRNPITNTRTFGDNADTVIKLAKGYLQAAREENMMTVIKHFPGDGVDERDQHLLTSINSLSVEEWENTFGRVYAALIDGGSKAIMAGHIACPAMVQKFNENTSIDEQYAPASLSSTLLNGLLREYLHFNGLIISDATSMTGFTSYMSRELAVPTCIASGCDMFLFNKNIGEDYQYMLKGYNDGIISNERLNDAVIRILGMKASLNLHTKHQTQTCVPTSLQMQKKLRRSDFRKWIEQYADKVPTLVRDNQQVLPLDVKKHKRILLNVIERRTQKMNPLAKNIKKQLEREGFIVDIRDRSTMLDKESLQSGKVTLKTLKRVKEITAKTESFIERYDAAIVVANMRTQSNETTVRLQFDALGNDIPWYVKEIPTVFVSFANPYHMLDVPMIPTVINAYSDTEEIVRATLDKLLGKSTFKGTSPIDPYCGKKDLQR